MKKSNIIENISFIILSLLAFLFVNCQGCLLIQVLGKTPNKGAINLITAVGVVIGLIVFLILKKTKKKKVTLGRFYLNAILVSGAAVVVIVYISALIVFRMVPIKNLNEFLESQAGIFIIYNIFFLGILLVGLIFAVVFTLLTKDKVSYIEYISEQVKNIEKNGPGSTLEIRGKDELAQLSESINHMSRTLLEKEEKERELITNVSHDLRNPMTSIMGYVELLRLQGTKDPEKFLEYIEVVHRRLGNLNGMINELFELTRLSGAGASLNISRQNASLLLRQLAEENEPLFKEKGLELKSHILKESVYMEIDPDKFARMIGNLLENGRKYSDLGKDVLFEAKREDAWLIIKVSNQVQEGKMPNIQNIFERFYKEDEARSDESSAGLGLSIVKRIAGLHGGTAIAESKGDIITFKISLPIKE